jgi:hypothetical protein
MLVDDIHHGYVPEKSMQKESEGMRPEMNTNINEMIVAINQLKCEHNQGQL